MLSTVTTDVQDAILGEDPSEGALQSVGLSLLTLVASLLCIFIAPGFALPVLAAFVVVTAFGWQTHQAEIARLLTLVATVLTVLTVTLITVYLFVSALPAFGAHSGSSGSISSCRPPSRSGTRVRTSTHLFR